MGINIVARLLGLDTYEVDEKKTTKSNQEKSKRITKDWKVDIEDSVEKASEEDESE